MCPWKLTEQKFKPEKRTTLSGKKKHEKYGKLTPKED